MEQTSVEWFLKNKAILKEFANTILRLLDLTRVDSHTLILAIVVINQLYRHESIKEYLDTQHVPDKVSLFIEKISAIEVSINGNDEKASVAASERKTLLDLCAQVFHSME